jgi:hypothetical protein
VDSEDPSNISGGEASWRSVNIFKRARKQSMSIYLQMKILHQVRVYFKQNLKIKHYHTNPIKCCLLKRAKEIECDMTAN